jgi:hypothetical protein
MFDFSYSDLRAAQALAVGNNQPVEVFAEVRSGVRFEVLYLPAVGRAGIAWGADAEWLDCASLEDAIKQYDAARYTL